MEQEQPLQPNTMPMMPGNLNDLKLLVQQFEMFLPEPQRNAIYNTIAQLESSGGIQSEEHGREILNHLMQSLGLTGLQK